MSLVERYTSEIQDEFAYLATWLPNVNLQLGDMGVIKRDRFEAAGSLDGIGLSYETTTPSSPMSYVYASHKGVNIEFLTGAGLPVVEPIVKASGRVRIGFSSEGAVVFIVNGLRSVRIKDQIALGKHIEKLYKRGDWDRRYSVVTELVTVDSATILVSQSRSAVFELEAKVDVAAEPLELVEGEAKFSVKRNQGLVFSAFGSAPLTPLFKASGIKRRLLRSSVFTTRAADADQEVESVFEEFNYADIDTMHKEAKSDRE